MFAELGPCQSSSSTGFCLQTGLEKGIPFCSLVAEYLFGLKGMLFFKFKYLCNMVIVLLLCPRVYLCVWSAFSSMIPLDFQVPGCKKSNKCILWDEIPNGLCCFVSLEMILLEVKAMKGNFWAFENLVSTGFHAPKKSALGLKLSRHRARLHKLLDGKGGCLYTLEDFRHPQSKLEHPLSCCYSAYNKPAWD